MTWTRNLGLHTTGRSNRTSIVKLVHGNSEKQLPDGRLPTPRPPQDYVYEELLTRTSWCNAEYAYREIERGRAQGNKAALWLRARLQAFLFYLGCSIQRRYGQVLIFGIVIMGAFSIGLKLAKMETNVEKLWVEGKLCQHFCSSLSFGGVL
jgi:acyl-CoA synthetase (AMP-forming)/AMP-acid ligase II